LFLFYRNRNDARMWTACYKPRQEAKLSLGWLTVPPRSSLSICRNETWTRTQV